tara:strand:+ start:18 stop:395 length:378 start_codon:yes stop_codon:yes gene_type:complete
MSKIKQTKIPVTVGLDNILRMAVEQGALENEFNWNLIRERDSLTKKSKDIKWLEFNEDGTYKEQFQKAEIGRSLIMSPFNDFFTWQTTPITEIIEERIGGYVKFKTGNSTYELTKIYSEPTGNPI